MKENIELLQIIGDSLTEHTERIDSLCYIHVIKSYTAIKQDRDICVLMEWSLRYVITWKSVGVDEYIMYSHL